jgi:nitrite reductase/ring-hydroxylating ferredoxin subunit
MGDIEDIDPKAVCHGAPLKKKTACVRCPRHIAKFGGGLWYNLESGASMTLGESSHHSPMYRVGTFEVKEEAGQILVSSNASNSSPALSLSDKAMIRIHKASKALGCSSCSQPSVYVPASDGPAQAIWQEWAVTSVKRVGQDSLMLRLQVPGGGKEGAKPIAVGQLWHVSIKVNVAWV